ncbi:hypothetical protein HPP92_001952 [Vanilla planifolia]|uniref:Transmembrane protein 135 N-terminal domain-containing protein n=1 Tax=Vanilla planifolia TaxID=51239 RepID=A0A835VLW2_VANPL|nr:hypothetical protein HPP92_001952 [Vanilla planifolia]
MENGFGTAGEASKPGELGSRNCGEDSNHPEPKLPTRFSNLIGPMPEKDLRWLREGASKRAHRKGFSIGAERLGNHICGRGNHKCGSSGKYSKGDSQIRHVLGGICWNIVTVDEFIAAIWGHNKSAYILKQESLPSSYRSFLNKHGGKAAAILEGLKGVTNTPFTNLDSIEKLYKSTGVDLKLDPYMKVPCSIVHGNQSCTRHAISFLIQEYKRALPVYLPVYLIPALIVHRQGLVKRPYTILAKGLIGTAKSSLFLSVYCASAWAWTCLLFRMFNRCDIPLIAAATFLTGLALLIEKKSRRIEIALYCFARAIESFFTCVAGAGYLPQASRLKRADVIVFSIATAIIMHCYAQERDVFRSKYLNVLDWVFGVPPAHEDDELHKRKAN